MKKRFLPFLLLSLLAVSSCGASSGKETYIGIISAMDNEIQLLLKEANIKEEKDIAGITYHIGTLKDKPVIISRSGIGKVNASSGITTLLNSFDISKVLFTGVAGGLRDDEEVLDVVVGTKVVEHDYGFITNDGFEWGGGDPGKKEPGEYYECDKNMVDLAYSSALSVMGEDHVFKGLIATGDQFIASSEYVEWLTKEFDAYACEMEGASVAKVCKNYNKPLAILRTLSDKADGNAHDSYADFGDRAADQSSKIVMKMLESLS